MKRHVVLVLVPVLFAAVFGSVPVRSQGASTLPAPAPLHIALSPDGTHIVGWASSVGRMALWSCALECQQAKTIAGSESPRGPRSGFPFWSPDGRFVAFFGNGALRKVELIGGSPQTLSNARDGNGGTWSRDDVIVFAPTGNGPLFSVSAPAGGKVTQLTELDRSRLEIAHRHPFFLPDGRHFLYLAISSREQDNAIWVGSLDSRDRTFLVSSGFKAAFAPPDYLLFMRQAMLMAQHFDPDRLALTGAPTTIARGVALNTANSAAGFTTSNTGTLAYLTGKARQEGGPITIVANWDRLLR